MYTVRLQKARYFFLDQRETCCLIYCEWPDEAPRRDGDGTIRLKEEYNLGDDPDVLFGLADELSTGMRSAESFHVTNMCVISPHFREVQLMLTRSTSELLRLAHRVAQRSHSTTPAPTTSRRSFRGYEISIINSSKTI